MSVILVLSLLMTGMLFGFATGYVFHLERNKVVKPLTYYECLRITNGTNVLLQQFGFKHRGSKVIEHGTVYTRKDGHKCIDVYDGDIEFTDADVWLDN